MIKISFNFDPETNAVSEVSVNGATEQVEKPKEKKASKPRKKKEALVTDKVTYNGASLQLNEEVLGLMGLIVGDRVCVRFNPEPVLLNPLVAKEPKGGNLITKGLTVSVKGKNSEQLGAPGAEFKYKLKSEGYLQLIRQEVENTDEQDYNEYVDSKATLKDETIGDLDDDDFLADIEEGEEINFELDID